MSMFVSVLTLLAWVVAIVGLFKKLPVFGVRRRWALLAFIAVPLIGGNLANVLESPQEEAAAASKEAQDDAWKREVAQMRAARGTPDGAGMVSIREYAWATGCGGYCMSFSGVIENQTTKAVKDIVIACQMTAESGAKFAAKKQTVYKAIPAGGVLRVKNLDMGPIHNQSARAACRAEAA